MNTPASSISCPQHILGRALCHLLAALTLVSAALHAQVPGLLSFQGRITVNSTNFTGNGQFKFALVDAAGTTSHWSHDGSSTVGSQPTTAVALPVANGLYAVLLGDTSISGMTQPIPAKVFADNSDVRVRVWFNDGSNGFQLLTPDQRIAAVGYALNAPVGVPRGAQEFKTAGTHTFTVPAGISTVLVEAWGAGGAAASATTSFSDGSGGGAGGYSRKSLSVTPGEVLTVFVGAGGAVSAPPNAGGNGGASGVKNTQNETLLQSSAGTGAAPTVPGTGGNGDPAAHVSLPGASGEKNYVNYYSARGGRPATGTVSSPLLPHNVTVLQGTPPTTLEYRRPAGTGGDFIINEFPPSMQLQAGFPGYVLIQW